MSPHLAGRYSYTRTFLSAAILVAGFIEPVLSQAQDTSALPYGPGVTSLTIEDDRQDRPLAGDLWYPTRTPEVFSQADKSQVWQMAAADPDGKPAEGRFPLLVLSHGMYGNTFNQAWLGSELSRRGYLVAMINHPGTSTFLRDPDQARELWDRPVDLSRVITFLLEDEATSKRIDPDRIYAAGHSLGGYTVMVLAGAKFDTERQTAICTGENQPVVCGVFAAWSVAETAADKKQMSVSRKDSRVRKVISMDLGGTPLFSEESLHAIDIPVLVLGSERADMLNQEVESRALAAALPANMVHHLELEDAGHFDFMGVCKPEAFEILKEEEPGDEIVCVKGSREREKQHRRIVAAILDFLEP
ncbi:alpha/beta hydrolase family protein [Roseibium aggregatum]|uniref:alpha/beta hydrolase family protein n=1 Tax=Roseibium aggregatum TaxID=187304 RepID=UPI001AD9356F|nr:alpha/beta fold hydrolase [Roseibium aggregatum]UES45198.1 alpha/beta fold hydrolase [Roseibium aggregatum]